MKKLKSSQVKEKKLSFQKLRKKFSFLCIWICGMKFCINGNYIKVYVYLGINYVISN